MWSSLINISNSPFLSCDLPLTLEPVFFHPVCLQQGSLQYAELNQNIGHHGDQGDTVDQHIEHVDHEGHSDQSVQQDHLVETETDPAVNGE